MAIPNQFGESPSPQNEENAARLQSGAALVTWVMERVKHARDDRDNKHKERWEEYTRLWRGFWTEEDKSNNSERSRLVAPALQQAVEMTAAEIEEAIFGRKAWFEVDDDIRDEQKEDAIAIRDQLLEDASLDRVPEGISESIFLGSLYGTGIAKLNVMPKMEYMLSNGEVVPKERVSVPVEAIRPDQFVIDPAAASIDEAQFCAHEPIKPLESVYAKMDEGLYDDVTLEPYTGSVTYSPDGAEKSYNVDDNAVLITEYYGLVPGSMLPGSTKKSMVEAIVTIANEVTLLRAMESPYTMKDRPIVAYQHEKVPGEFWGRGVGEKGYNPQKALDAELRARIDTMALLTAPMMGADITRLPRNPDMRVRPGKVWLTRGRPSEILEPIQLGMLQPSSFQQSGDLERMVQMGTGAMDSASPLSTNRRNETASGMSMIQTGFIKRAKRTMQSIERKFLNPLVQKMLWRYMQFDPERYPTDYKFVVNSGMGIMAKELEQQQLIQLLGFVPPESPAHSIILSAIFDNTPSANKKVLKEAIDAMVQAAQPTPEQQQMQKMAQELQMRLGQAEAALKEAEVAKTQAEVMLTQAKAFHEKINADLEDDRVQNESSRIAVEAENSRIQRRQVDVAERKVEVDARRPKSST